MNEMGEKYIYFSGFELFCKTFVFPQEILSQNICD